MDKNKLIAVLAYKLESSGVARDSAIAEAKAFVGALSDEEAAKLMPHLGNDALMSRIAESLKKRTETSSSLPVPVKQTQPQQQKRISAEDNKVNPQGQKQRAPVPQKTPATAQRPKEQEIRTPVPVPVKPLRNEITAPKDGQQAPVNGQNQIRKGSVPEYGQRPERMPRPNRMQNPMPQRNDPGRRGGINREAGAEPKRTNNNRPVGQERIQNPIGRAAAEKSAVGKSKKRFDFGGDRQIIYRPDPNADYKKFYIILACTSPVWLFLLIAGLMIFLSVLGGMCISIVLLILALAAGVAAGTVLCLVGVIYGITQLFKYAPIGLYEIGLGLMIGGVTMFLGIIVYNVAVRLLPFLIKKVFALLIYSMHKCVELYFYVKGACADL